MSDPSAFREERALAQRQANERARAAGEPLPYPNVWDALDPTKVAPDAPIEALAASYREFAKVCRKPPCRHHVL